MLHSLTYVLLCNCLLFQKGFVLNAWELSWFLSSEV